MTWQRSSFCSKDACVEVTHLTDLGLVNVRHSAEPGFQLTFTAAEWAAFTAGVRAGEFDGEA